MLFKEIIKKLKLEIYDYSISNEKFGKITLQEHFNRIAVEGQEYDPYTTMFAKAPAE